MHYNTKLVKILLTAFSIGFLIWFGGNLVRSAVGFDLFYPTADMLLKTHYTNEIRMHSAYLFATLALYPGVAYIAAFLTAIVLFFLLRKQMKREGWLFMAFILFFLASPMELYLLWMDVKLSLAVYYGNVKDFADPAIQNYLIPRFKNVAFTTGTSLAFLANLTALLYVIWRPLSQSKAEAIAAKEIVE
ncbi:MAG: hypothetical protein ACM3U1_06990 [Chloroflexota bacterium]